MSWARPRARLRPPTPPRRRRPVGRAHLLQEELVVESVALTVIGGLGYDTSDYCIPYITSWSNDDAALEIIETCAGLIDQLAKRSKNAIGDPPPGD